MEYPPSHHYQSRLMATVGRLDASLEAARIARDLEPDSQVLNSRLAIACFWTNDMACASRYYDIANTMGTGAPIHQLSYAMFLIRENRVDEARDVARRAMGLYQLDPAWVDPVFDGLAQSSASATMIAALEEYSARDVIPPPVLITFWVLAGQADRAMEMTWKLVDDPSYFEIELIFLDEFRTLRQHVDFPRFLDELGISEYWRGVGCHWDIDEGVCSSN